MRRLATIAILAILLLTSGCTLAEGLFWAGGSDHYTGGGSDFNSRSSHFAAEHERWENR